MLNSISVVGECTNWRPLEQADTLKMCLLFDHRVYYLMCLDKYFTNLDINFAHFPRQYWDTGTRSRLVSFGTIMWPEADSRPCAERGLFLCVYGRERVCAFVCNKCLRTGAAVSRCWVAHLGKVCQSGMIYEEMEVRLTACEWASTVNDGRLFGAVQKTVCACVCVCVRKRER